MSDGFTQVPPDSTGDKIDTEQLTVSAQTVQRQRIQIAGATDTAIAPVDGTAGLKVDLGADNDVVLATGSNEIGSLAASTNNIGDVDVLSLPASTNTLEVVGDVAENAPAAGNPVLVGGRFDSTPRVLADLDAGAIALAADGAVHIDDGGNTITVDGTVTADAGTGTFNVDLDSLAATAIDVNNGTVSAGTQRVTIASDSTGQVDVTDRAARDNGTIDIAATLPTGANKIGSALVSGTHVWDNTSGGLAEVEVKFASVDVASSGDNTIVALVSGKELRVISYVLVASGGANTLQWKSSTAGAITGGMGLADTGGISADSATGLFATTAGEALVLNLSAATSVDGHISYIEVD